VCSHCSFELLLVPFQISVPPPFFFCVGVEDLFATSSSNLFVFLGLCSLDFFFYIFYIIFLVCVFFFNVYVVPLFFSLQVWEKEEQAISTFLIWQGEFSFHIILLKQISLCIFFNFSFLKHFYF